MCTRVFPQRSEPEQPHLRPIRRGRIVLAHQNVRGVHLASERDATFADWQVSYLCCKQFVYLHELLGLDPRLARGAPWRSASTVDSIGGADLHGWC